jgi:putative component of toxin-antitoxin plasmid stabilization module
MVGVKRRWRISCRLRRVIFSSFGDISGVGRRDGVLFTVLGTIRPLSSVERG